ncbi:hypothetical protein V6N13_074138 [Hibiscus sabdariffa]
MDDQEEFHYLQEENIAAAKNSDTICCSNFIQIKYFEKLKKEDVEELDETPCGTHQVSSFTIRLGMRFAALDFSDFTSPKPSLEHAPSLELKPLPPHLNSWVCHVQCVPKKGGITVVTNEKNELLPTRKDTGRHICMDYRKLNKATKKDHFPLHFIDQMLDRLAGKAFYCFLDGYSGYKQLFIAPEDQEKTTFTCPYGTYAFRRMHFGLCNASATFQRCMLAIFSDMVEEVLEVFMDDSSMSRETFDLCMGNLDKVLKRCKEADLVLNWEKCHFMVNKGTILGHKISSKGIEVDNAKVEVIEKLPPPTNQNQPFVFDKECQSALEELKMKLISAPVVVPPDWTSPFELMCDASDHAIGAALGQRREFDIEVKDRKGTENQVADHISRHDNPHNQDKDMEISDSFPDEKILSATAIPWYVDIVNFLVSGIVPPDLSSHSRKKFRHDAKFFYRVESYLFKQCADQVLRRCVPEEEHKDIMYHCHDASCGGNRTAAKILQSDFYWPTLFKDAHAFAKACDRFQRTRNISRRNEMSLQNILEVELFDVWGIDFMGSFPSSHGDLYILLAVDYVSKWVEAIATPRNDAKTVMKFLHKNIFTRFGVPRAIISNEGSHFDNKLTVKALQRYGIRHRIATAYHLQTNDQAKVSNREIDTTVVIKSK